MQRQGDEYTVRPAFARYRLLMLQSDFLAVRHVTWTEDYLIACLNAVQDLHAFIRSAAHFNSPLRSLAVLKGENPIDAGKRYNRRRRGHQSAVARGDNDVRAGESAGPQCA